MTMMMLMTTRYASTAPLACEAVVAYHGTRTMNSGAQDDGVGGSIEEPTKDELAVRPSLVYDVSGPV
jgi:hypothetical protein